MAEEESKSTEDQQQGVEASQQAPAPASETSPANAPAGETSPAVEPQPRVEAAAAPRSAPQPRVPSGRGQSGPGGRGGDRRGGGRGRGRRDDRQGDDSGIESSVVKIDRVSKVVKGGRTFSLTALVVAGDRKGSVGIGYGKANEVPPAVEKATKEARKSMVKITLKGGTIPHQVKGRFGATTVVLVPARPGTGVTAGKSVRPVLELAGITDILSKLYGSSTPVNVVKATYDALEQLRSREKIAEMRGVSIPSAETELVNA
jgi:small subunit ribosomal protein S5